MLYDNGNESTPATLSAQMSLTNIMLAQKVRDRIILTVRSHLKSSDAGITNTLSRMLVGVMEA